MRSSLVLVPAGIVAGLIGALSTSEPARANCYELIGCSDKDYYQLSDLMQLGCQPLWEVRNWIYKERGYCFKTPNAIKAFGNAGCLYDETEAKKGC